MQRARASAVTVQKWGGLASFLMAVAFLVAPLIYLVGNLREAFGPLTYNLADFLYGPVCAASLITAVFALRERMGDCAPRRMTLALLAAALAAGAFVAVACIRVCQPSLPSDPSRAAPGDILDGPHCVDHPRGRHDRGSVALPGVDVDIGRIGRLDIPQSSPMY